ncbi:hypothetical protein [Streptomyces sp. NPDC002588]|uniref:hypothetical protein n=1 Tax=Streptomyces sp. NPDC002588 TaxID=3154419 RepID=UPI00333257E2
MDTSLRAFADDLEAHVDEGRDAGHFIDRVGTYFVGRRHQLRQLAPWLDSAADGGICVVTDDPGSGKSALLGAIVCAAHPVLCAALPQVSGRLEALDPEGGPSPNENLAAVHARQRGIDEVLTSLGRQLGLTSRAGGAIPADFVHEVRLLAEAPALVIDALDDAGDPVGIATLVLQEP